MSLSAWLSLAVFAAFAAAGAWSDARHRTIPNALNVAMAVLGIAAVWLTLGGHDALWAAAHFLIALVVGMAIYALRVWGGGDAKFYAATAAWFPLREAPALLVGVALAGLVLVLVWLPTRRFIRGQGHGLKTQVPYGLAIAAGGLITMGFGRLAAG